MERTNFEKLQVYQLSEKIADSVWNIVVTWSPFARDTRGKQIVRAADRVSVQTSPKAAAAEVLSTTADLCEWLEARFTKLFTGYAVRT